MTHTEQQLRCPICDWAAEVPQPQYAPGLAAVFGLDAATLASIHLRQEQHRLEANIERHMRTHGPGEWLPALMEARNALAAARTEATTR